MRFSRSFHLWFLSTLFIFLATLPLILRAQSRARIVDPVDNAIAMRIPGTTHPYATIANDRGRVGASLELRHMLLPLKPSVDQDAALGKLIDTLDNPDSPSYQHWLTPEQFAAQFGPSPADIEQISSWLRQRGFSVDSVARGGLWIEFSGTASQVEQSFHTEMHHYLVHNQMHIANSADISIPSALAPVVAGVLSLHNFEKPSLRGPSFRVHRDPLTAKLVPDTRAHTSNGDLHYVSPGDYTRIYDTAPLLQSGVNGTGVSIAIAGRTDIELSDVQTFRQIFGLPANDPLFFVNGQHPGITGDEVESDLDVEWAGAVAPNATIKFVTSASTFTTDGIDLSVSYIVDNVFAPIMSTSYGQCEAFLGNTGNTFYTLLYKQAAAEGITALVSSGDNGAAGCDPTVSFSPAQKGPNVSGLASTQYNIAVGGTQFNENGHDSTYWGPNNNPDFSSALGYIPENVWNESCDPTVDPNNCTGSFEYFLLASSGGRSSCTNSIVINFQITCLGGYAKPSWQAGRGIAKDGVRDLPDLSLAAAGAHDGYLMCVEGSCQTTTENGQLVLQSATVVGGTSAAAPAMAGIMGLLEQQNGSFQGLANYNFYKLAARDKLSACNSSNLTNPGQPSNCTFHDVTSGDSFVPGQAGYSAGIGFDLSTGLGSPDAANLVGGWKLAKKLASATALSSNFGATVQHGQPLPVRVVVTPAPGTGTPTGDFALETDKYGTAYGGTLSNGVFDSSVTSLPGGHYNLIAHYGGDAMFSASASASIPINVRPEPSSLALSGWEVNLIGLVVPIFGPVNYGQPVALQFNAKGFSGVGAPTGKVSISLDSSKIGVFPLDEGGGGWVQVDNLPASGLMPGHHVFSVAYEGDQSFSPSKPASFSVQVRRVFPSSFAHSAGPITLTEGSPVVVLLSVLGQGVLPPSGTVQLYDNGRKLGNPITLSNHGPQGDGIAQATLTLALKKGPHKLRLGYAGDGNYDPVNADNFNAHALNVTINAAAGRVSNIELRQSSASLNLGDSATYTVTIKGNPRGPVPTGTVSLNSRNGILLAPPTPLSVGTVTFVVPWYSAGNNPVSASYSGDTTYSPFSSREIWTSVRRATPTVTLTAASSTLPAGTQTSLTVSLLGQPSNPNLTVPFGLVQFFESVDGGPLHAMGFRHSLTTGNGGGAVYSLPVVFSSGTHRIQVNYFGSSDWSRATSNPVTVTVR
jgi:hypothetical protein